MSYPKNDDTDATLDRELLLSLGILTKEELEADPDSVGPSRTLVDLLDSGEPVSSADIMPFLPRGIEDEHAAGMKGFLYDLDWMCLSVGFPGLAMEYARRMSYGYILPIAKRLVRFDEETIARTMFPENYLDSEEARVFYVKRPECIGKLWANMCLYLGTNFPGFESNVAAVSTFFYLSQRRWFDVVELTSLALMRHRAIDFARRGEFSGIVKSVRRTEAEVLAESLAVCRK